MSLGFLRVCGLVALAVLPSLGVTAAPTPTVPAMRPLPLDAGTPTGSLGGALRMLHDGGGRPGGDTAPSLSGALTADGRLRPTARGSFSAAGYTLVSEPGRAPRFVASQAATGTYSGAFRANVPNDEIATIAVLSPTEFVVGGSFIGLGGDVGTNFLARWDGSAWQALGGGVDNTVWSLAVSGSDLYVGGDFTQAFATAGDVGSGVAGTNFLARWDGSSWHALGGGVDNTVWSLAVSGADVYVGGSFAEAYAIAGDVSSGVAATSFVARWDGTAWHPLQGSVNDEVYALVVSGSDLYVGGSFTEAYAAADDLGSAVAGTAGVARWDGSAWQALGGGVDYTVNALAVSSGDVYVGGDFTQAFATAGDVDSGVAGTAGVARWDGSVWHALGGGVEYTVWSLAVSGTDVYVAGFFDQAYEATDDVGSGVAGTQSVARWDGSAWQAFGGGVSFAGSDPVQALAVGPDGAVYVGGHFEQAYASGGVLGGRSANGVAGTYGVARWSAASGWQPLGGGIDGVAKAIVVETGGDVYVGGTFSQAFAVAGAAGWQGSGSVAGTYRVARWNATTGWKGLGGGVGTGIVNALALAAGGDLYVAGDFVQTYATAASFGQGGANAVAGTARIARWSPATGWHPLGGGVGSGDGSAGFGAVHAVAVGPGGEVYVGGTFLQAFATPGASPGQQGTSPVAGTLRVARWSASSGWQALGGGVGFGAVHAVAVGPGGAVYVGGTFGMAYGTAGGAGQEGTDAVPGSRCLARWSDATGWQALGAGVAQVFTLACGQAPAASPSEEVSGGAPVPALFIGGSFTGTGDGGRASNLTYYTEALVSSGKAEDRGGTGLVLAVLDNATSAPRVRLDVAGTPAPVTVDVFDVAGRRTSVLHLTVDGRREVEVGAGLATGVYLVRATLGGTTRTATVVVR